MSMEETTDVKQKTTPSIPANYVTILQLRERWIKEKERTQREEKDEGRRRNQHAEEQHIIVEDDPEKPQEDLDEMRLNQSDQKKHRGGNSKEEESTDGGEARWGEEEEEEETAAIGREKGEGDGLPEKKKRGRRKRYNRKKKKEVEECGSIKPPECTVKEENNTPLKDQLRVYRKKEEKAIGNKSVEKAATVAVETQFEHLSIKRGQETKHLKAQTRSLNRNPIETAAMVWVKKGQNERSIDGNRSGVKKPLHG